MGTSELFISLAQPRDRLEQRRGFDRFWKCRSLDDSFYGLCRKYPVTAGQSLADPALRGSNFSFLLC